MTRSARFRSENLMMGNLARHSGGEGKHSTGDAIQLLVDTPYVPDES